jgi:hypothetical protein
MNNVLLKKFLLISISIAIFCIVSKYTYERLENKSEVFFNNVKSKQKIKIYDIIHNNIPSARNLKIIVDSIPFILLFYILFIDVNLFYAVLGMLIPIFIVRLFVINITILPKDKKCDIVKQSSPYVGGCYDKVYSGHFAVFFTCLLFLYKKKYVNMFVFALSSIIMGTLIVASRSHYTIDVIVSFLIVLVFYQNKISACRIIDKYIK